MLTSLAFIFLVGLSMAAICNHVKLPRIIGTLVTGIVLGPFVLDLLDPQILGISSELRKMALIIILIKAGLEIKPRDLKKIGLPAALMTVLPATFEMLGFAAFAPYLIPVTRIEALIIGAVLGAVSPAIVVPRMLALMERKVGTKKNIPQLILAASSLDDVFVIVIFTTLVHIALGGCVTFMDFADIPISIVLGIALGAITGYALSMFFETAYAHEHCIRNSMKQIILLGAAFLLVAIEAWVEKFIALSGLLAVMSMACVIAMKSTPFVSERLSEKFGKLWIAAEVILFVLVGAAVDIRYTMGAGLGAVIMIIVALIFRSIGVLIALIPTNLTRKEKLFCVISYIPKATVQAAIGSIPLSLGLSCGKIVLSVAVLSIIMTAPVGAFAIDFFSDRLLTREDK